MGDSKADMQDGRAAVEAALLSRRSVRGFTSEAVPRKTVERILSLASRAPSGSNIQPWRVYVLTGTAKERLSQELLAAHYSDAPRPPLEYDYYPRDWRDPYLSRRRKIGWDLYSLLGIAKGDHEASSRYHAGNYEFFGAPVGLIFAIDRDLPIGAWLDFGMFLHGIMTAARGFGLDTCPQAAFAVFHPIVRRQLSIPQSMMIVCGMALGHADRTDIANRLTTEREPVANFATFLDN